MGFPWLRTALMACFCVLAIWWTGMMTSFFCQPRPDSGNRDAHSAGHQYPTAAGREQLVALHTLQGELERLQYRIRHGTPWYQRFGLGA